MFKQTKVWRVGDSYARMCKSCHRAGQVGIYPGREAESLHFISRPNWVCRWCENLKREVENAILERRFGS